jgi:hypothetical protein
VGLTIQRLPSSCICLLSASGSGLLAISSVAPHCTHLSSFATKIYMIVPAPLPRRPCPPPRARRWSRFVTAKTVTSLLSIRSPDGTEGVMPYNALLLTASIWGSNRFSHTRSSPSTLCMDSSRAARSSSKRAAMQRSPSWTLLNRLSEVSFDRFDLFRIGVSRPRCPAIVASSPHLATWHLQ